MTVEDAITHLINSENFPGVSVETRRSNNNAMYPGFFIAIRSRGLVSQMMNIMIVTKGGVARLVCYDQTTAYFDLADPDALELILQTVRTKLND